MGDGRGLQRVDQHATKLTLLSFVLIAAACGNRPPVEPAPPAEPKIEVNVVPQPPAPPAVAECALEILELDLGDSYEQVESKLRAQHLCLAVAPLDAINFEPCAGAPRRSCSRTSVDLTVEFENDRLSMAVQIEWHADAAAASKRLEEVSGQVGRLKTRLAGRRAVIELR